ncbi:MAG: tyrosine-type recombinase/integrase [Calditrichaeota bacterium]|jgi:site-specific recombinase XerD|nr:tyrosine-type recombinase/integrase [Calditrichota bacterium]
MAVIYERTTNKGITKYYIDVSIDGKRYKRCLSEYKDEAHKLFETIKRERSIDCLYQQPERLSWSKAILEFLKYVELFSVSHGHVRQIDSRLKSFKSFCQENGATNLGSIGVIHARKYLFFRMNQEIKNKYKFSPENLTTTPAISTINREISLYKRFFRFCLENDWIPKNPWLPIRRFPDPVKRRPRYHFSDKELEKIFQVAEEFYDYYYFLLFTGIRPTDAFGLKVGSFDGRYLSFQMRKTGDWMSNIPMPDHVIKTLGNRIKGENMDQLVFTELASDRQRRYCRRRVQEVFEPEFVREKFINLHTFRHTYAHRMLDRGMPKEVLQTFLGHKSIRTTEIYANWVKSEELEKWVLALND